MDSVLMIILICFPFCQNVIVNDFLLPVTICITVNNFSSLLYIFKNNMLIISVLKLMKNVMGVITGKAVSLGTSFLVSDQGQRIQEFISNFTPLSSLGLLSCIPTKK